MNKNLDTLIEDIYSVLSSGVELGEKDYEKFGQDMARLLKSKLTPKKRDAKGRLWFSMLGKKDRQIWYSYHGYEGEPIDGPAYLKFLMGDVWEALLLFLAKASGHTVEDEQKPLALDGVTGRQDATIDGVKVDVKSASSYSFKKFKNNTLKHNDPFGYYYQIAGYSQAEKEEGDRVAFLAAEKQTGALALLNVTSKDLPNARERVAHIKEMVKGEIPERCYPAEPMGSSGNEALSSNCSYCQHKHTCWADANGGEGLRTFFYSSGPVFLTKVVKTPDVPEKRKSK